MTEVSRHEHGGNVQQLGIGAGGYERLGVLIVESLLGDCIVAAV